MSEIYREIITDKNGNAYLLLVGIQNGEIEADLYCINKTADGSYEVGKWAGLCLLEKQESATYEALYTVDLQFRGLGLGSKLVEFSKRFCREKLGAKEIRLHQLPRKVPHPLYKNLNYDANLELYLKHNFKIQAPAYQSSIGPIMTCDLEQEENLSYDEIMLNILNNKKAVYNSHLK